MIQLALLHLIQLFDQNKSAHSSFATRFVHVYNLMQSEEHSAKYKKLKLIGKGAYGKIYLIELFKDHKRYALKKMKIRVS